jgi:uncharacterized protein YwgA
MDINVRHVVLLAVEQVGNRPNGKTYLQKLCYFVQRLTSKPLGFRAHYYGPYSDQVSAELSFLSAAGLLCEVRRGSGIAGSGGWEIARYDYSLTDQGREALAQIVGQLQDAEGIRAAIGRVLAAGDNDYVDLSFAAKTDWILESEHGAMTPEGIAKAATRFNWNVSGTDVQKAATFLSNLGLVQLSPSVAV